MAYRSEAITTDEVTDRTKRSKQPNDISDIIGPFGLWQKKICLAVLYFEFMGAIANLSSALLLPEIPFKCDLNFTKHSLLKSGAKFSIVGGNQSPCMVTLKRKGLDSFLPCNKWNFSHEVYKHSFTEEFNLVCDKAWLISFSNTVTILGDLLACCVFGYMSDRFGRRRTLMFLVFPVLAGALVSLFASTIEMFLIGRFLLGAGGHGGVLVSFILLMEAVGSKQRASLGISIKFGFTAGGIFIGILSYWLRDSLQIQAVMTVAFLMLIPVAFTLPESPRWLMVSNYQDGISKAKAILRKAAQCNGIESTNVDENVQLLSRKMIQDCESINRKYGFFDLIKYPNLRRKTLILIFLWSVNGFCYYGITLISTRLGADPLVSFILILGVEFPAYILIVQVANHKDYKLRMACGFLLNAVIFITSSQAGIETGWSVILVILFAKVGSILSGCSTCNYATDVFPTVVRSLGLGTCIIVSRVLVLLSTFLKELAEATSMSTVFALLASLSFACLLCVTFLPDTDGKPSPETIEESERIGLTRPWKSWHLSRKLNYFRYLRN